MSEEGLKCIISAQLNTKREREREREMEKENLVLSIN